MVAKSQLGGLVIAGGRSVRFGGEKAVALFGGRPMLLRAVDRLRAACDRVAVNARPGTAAEALARDTGLEVLHDLAGDPDGPLAGVHAGLAWARELGLASLAVSPCDAPLLPPDLFASLARAAGEGAAIAATADGRQPLCAIWPVAALDRVASSLAGGAHPPTWRVLEEAGAVRVEFDAPGAFANVNTREELAALESARYQR